MQGKAAYMQQCDNSSVWSLPPYSQNGYSALRAESGFTSKYSLNPIMTRAIWDTTYPIMTQGRQRRSKCPHNLTDPARTWSKSLPKLISFRLICNTSWGDADIPLYHTCFPTIHLQQIHQKPCPIDDVDVISLASGLRSAPAALIRPRHPPQGFG